MAGVGSLHANAPSVRVELSVRGGMSEGQGAGLMPTPAPSQFGTSFHLSEPQFPHL